MAGWRISAQSVMRRRLFHGEAAAERMQTAYKEALKVGESLYAGRLDKLHAVERRLAAAGETSGAERGAMEREWRSHLFGALRAKPSVEAVLRAGQTALVVPQLKEMDAEQWRFANGPETVPAPPRP